MASGFGKVLVVDDDVEIRETLSALLQHEGYDVSRAENGVQALEQLRRFHPDVVLLDLMMPVMSGWEVLDALQESGEIDQVPIIVVSAMGAPGARACLRKPVDLDELLAVVGRCCCEGHDVPRIAAQR
ncbi:MAG TPA: response regulator [Polyangiaceae bacterium]|jgi:CheY-like chemotaxis protein